MEEKETAQKQTSEEEGFIFDEEGELVAYVGTEKSIRIPSKVERLPNNLFKKNDFLEEVIINRSVKFVGSSCFKGCKSLKKVVFDADVNSIPIKCFKNCRSLTDIEIKSPLYKISMEAFMNCESLEKIKLTQQVRTIGISAFNGCTNLKEVTDVNGVLLYDNMCFKNTAITNIELIRAKIIGAYAFAGTPIQSLTIPSSCNSIRVGAFSGCNELESVKVKSDVALFEFGAFSKCDKLKAVMFDDVVAIQGLAAFHKLDKLDTVFVTKDSKPFIGFSSLFISSNPNEESNDKVLFDVGLAVDTEGSGALMLTQNVKELNSGLTLNQLNKCMKYIKDRDPKRLEIIKNRQLHLSAMCATQAIEDIEEYSDFLYCYKHSHLTNNIEYFINLCKANEKSLTRPIVIDLSKEVEEDEVREYLLSLISLVDFENQTSNFSTSAPALTNTTESSSNSTPTSTSVVESNSSNALATVDRTTQPSKPIAKVNSEATTNIVKSVASGAVAGKVGGVKGAIVGGVLAGVNAVSEEIQTGNVEVNLMSKEELTSAVQTKIGDIRGGAVSADNKDVIEYYKNYTEAGLKYLKTEANVAYAVVTKSLTGISEFIVESTTDTRANFIQIDDNRMYISPKYIRTVGNNYNKLLTAIPGIEYAFNIDKNVISKGKFTTVCGAFLTEVDGKFVVSKKGSIISNNPEFETKTKIEPITSDEMLNKAYECSNGTSFQQVNQDTLKLEYATVQSALVYSNGYLYPNPTYFGVKEKDYKKYIDKFELDRYFDVSNSVTTKGIIKHITGCKVVKMKDNAVSNFKRGKIE